MRRLAALATITTAAAAIGAFGAVSLAGMASADGAGAGVVTEETKSYTRPTNTSEPIHLFREGDVVDVVCFTLSENPDAEGRIQPWFRVAPARPIGERTTGYVPASVIQPSEDAPPVTLQRC